MVNLNFIIFDIKQSTYLNCYSSGVKPTEKREGSGSHNWGTVKDDIE